jgi:hypothetical protein
MKIKRLLSLCVLGLVLTTFVATALAADYYAIVDGSAKKPRTAFMDVSVDTTIGAGIDVLFDVYDARGIQLAEFTVPANSYGFASSSSWGNLFNLAAGQPILVRAQTPYAPTDAATVHIDSLGASTVVGVFPIRKRDNTLLSMGTDFALALGSFRSATLLIANLSGSDVAVDVFKGSRGADGFGIFSNPRITTTAIWRVNLTQSEALSKLIVRASNPIIMQAVINDGQTIQSFMVLPAQ